MGSPFCHTSQARIRPLHGLPTAQSRNERVDGNSLVRKMPPHHENEHYATLPSLTSHDTVLSQASQNFFTGNISGENTPDFSTGARTFQWVRSTNAGLRTRHLAREQAHKLDTDIAMRSHIEGNSR